MEEIRKTPVLELDQPACQLEFLLDLLKEKGWTITDLRPINFTSQYIKGRVSIFPTMYHIKAVIIKANP